MSHVVAAPLYRANLAQYVKGRYVKKEEDRSHTRSQKVPRNDNNDSESDNDIPRSGSRLVAMVIFGGYSVEGGETKRTMKRKSQEIVSNTSSSTTYITSGRTLLIFEDRDLVDGKLNRYIPLVIQADMGNFEVRRILVDQGSSVDIMFADLLIVLGITKDDLIAYRGADLSGFQRSKTMSLGYIELMITYSKEPLTRTI